MAARLKTETSYDRKSFFRRVVKIHWPDRPEEEFEEAVVVAENFHCILVIPGFRYNIIHTYQENGSYR